MKKNKFIVMVAMALALLVLPTTTYAAEAKSIESIEGDTTKQLLLVGSADVYSYAPYISASFRPDADYIVFLFGGWGTASATYTYYLEEQRSDGTWRVVDSYSCGGRTSSSISGYITPYNLYRVRVTTNDPYPYGVYLEVYEIIFD